MVTKNWYNQFKSNMGMTTIPTGVKDLQGTAYTSGYASTSYAGSLVSGLLFQNAIVAKAHNTLIASRGICLGSGTTPATIDDYKLENPITTGFSASVVRQYDAQYNSTFVITLTNTSADDIVIGEIGYVGDAHYGAGNSYAAYVLFDRTVLDSPITIPAGGIGQITYTIRLNYPA